MVRKLAGFAALALLLIQAAPSFSCAADAPKMPCCIPSSHCAAGLAAPSCCGLDAPAERQQEADRGRATPRPGSAQGAAMTAAPAFAALQDAVACPPDDTGSPPHQSSVPLYLRFGSLLR